MARAVLESSVWHIWKERKAKIFQRQERRKIIVFRGLYEDVRELLRTCNWKSEREVNVRAIMSNWDV